MAPPSLRRCFRNASITKACPSHFLFFFLISRLYLLDFRFTKKLSKCTDSFHISHLCLPLPTVSPTINILHWLVHLLWLMNEYWYMTIIRLHWHSLFVLRGSMGFDQCIRSCIHHYSIMYNDLTLLKNEWSFLFLLKWFIQVSIIKNLITSSVMFHYLEGVLTSLKGS